MDRKEFDKDALIHDILSTVFCDGWKSHLLKDSSSKESIEHAKHMLFNYFNQEVKAVLKRVKSEIIGEDEHPLVKSEYPEVGKLSFDFTQFDEAIKNNQLRNIQRQALLKIKKGYETE